MYTAFYRHNTSGDYIRSDLNNILVNVIGGDFINGHVTLPPVNSPDAIDYRTWLAAGNTPTKNGDVDSYDIIGYRVQHRD